MTGQPGRIAGLPVVIPIQPGPRDDAATDPPTDRAAGVVAVFQVHYVHLVRLARHLLDDPNEAEDVVMDAFVGLSRRWAHVRRSQDVFFYLRASVVNGSHSRLRRLRIARDRRHTQVERDSAPAEQLAMVHLEHDSVIALLRALPRRQREVLVLRYYADLSEQQIADAVGISPGAVKSHASRGVAALRRTLELSA
ncbi:MAG TPA: SigE family RNA polymerase sigma factor [Actinomycetes bacterium]|nr:SigE family RNA polymerase sigma factor [Actinomycetes bacterium]